MKKTQEQGHLHCPDWRYRGLGTDLAAPNALWGSVGNVWLSPLSGRSSSPTSGRASPRSIGRVRILRWSGPCSLPLLLTRQPWAVDARSLVPFMVAHPKSGGGHHEDSAILQAKVTKVVSKLLGGKELVWSWWRFLPWLSPKECPLSFSCRCTAEPWPEEVARLWWAIRSWRSFCNYSSLQFLLALYSG